MHMADALISPVVGLAMCGASAAGIAYCSSKLKKCGNERAVPLMGVMGAFAFTAQMVNFAIPMTGSSGHIGGGLLLAILLGPEAAFLTMASVLFVQAFFLGDGGLLALGCNIINLGFFPAYVGWRMVSQPLIGDKPGKLRLYLVSALAAVVGLQLGALGVVIQTWASGVSGLPFKPFLMLMQPIHLAIGLFEGVATAAIVAVVMRIRPDVVEMRDQLTDTPVLRPVLLMFAVFALLLGLVLSRFASERPDGLEWSIQKLTFNKIGQSH